MLLAADVLMLMCCLLRYTMIFSRWLIKYWTPYLMHFYPMKRLSPIDLSQTKKLHGGETLCWNNTAFFHRNIFTVYITLLNIIVSTCKWNNKWKLSNIIHPYLHSNAEMLLASSVMSRVVWCVVMCGILIIVQDCSVFISITWNEIQYGNNYVPLRTLK